MIFYGILWFSVPNSVETGMTRTFPRFSQAHSFRTWEGLLSLWHHNWYNPASWSKAAVSSKQSTWSTIAGKASGGVNQRQLHGKLYQVTSSFLCTRFLPVKKLNPPRVAYWGLHRGSSGLERISFQRVVHVDLHRHRHSRTLEKRSVSLPKGQGVALFCLFKWGLHNTPEPTLLRQTVPPLHEKRTTPQIEQGPLCAACNPAKTMQNDSRLQHWSVAIKLLSSGMLRTLHLLAAMPAVRPKTLYKDCKKDKHPIQKRTTIFRTCLSIRFILRIYQMHRCHWHTSVTCEHVQHCQPCTTSGIIEIHDNKSANSSGRKFCSICNAQDTDEWKYATSLKPQLPKGKEINVASTIVKGPPPPKFHFFIFF